MRKRQKVRRYTYEYGGQKKIWWKKTLSIASIVLVAGLLGWFGYQPVYDLVVNGMAGQVQPPPSTSAPASESAVPPPAASQQPEAPAPSAESTAGLPTSTYYLPPAVVGDNTSLGAALAHIKTLGGTGVAFDLKDSTGLVLYKSALPEVITSFAQSEAPYDLAGVMQAVKAAGLTPVGRLYAFQDSTATSATAMNGGAVKYMDSKINWLDNAKADGGKAWLNPNSAIARDYILKLVEETTGMGLGCVILDGVQFPTGLSLSLATYGGVPDRSAVLAAFLQTARGLAEKNSAVLYPVITLRGLAGLDETPYGAEPGKLIAAAGTVLINVEPRQFGNGVTTPQLTLAKPQETPYDTVKTALAAAQTALQQQPDAALAAMVQQYTAPTAAGVASIPYGAQQAAQQALAAKEAGIDRVFYYNPNGSY